MLKPGFHSTNCHITLNARFPQLERGPLNSNNTKSTRRRRLAGVGAWMVLTKAVWTIYHVGGIVGAASATDSACHSFIQKFAGCPVCSHVFVLCRFRSLCFTSFPTKCTHHRIANGLMYGVNKSLTCISFRVIYCCSVLDRMQFTHISIRGDGTIAKLEHYHPTTFTWDIVYRSRWRAFSNIITRI